MGRHRANESAPREYCTRETLGNRARSVVLSVQTVSGKPLALLANYSLHYVGGVNKVTSLLTTLASFPNRSAKLLNAGSANPQFIGMMSNGTSGDINNINFRDGNAVVMTVTKR